MLMPRSLWMLKYLEMRGWLRRLLKVLKRPVGIFILIVYLFMFGPATMHAFFFSRSDVSIPPEWIARTTPVSLALVFLIILIRPGAGNAFSFKPAEIDVLFSGPYTRRHIVTYKLLGNISGALFLSLIMFVTSFAFVPARLPLLAGAFLSFLFMFLFISLYGVLIQAVSARIRFAGYALTAAILLLAANAVYAMFNEFMFAAQTVSDPSVLANRFFDHPLIQTISFPFVPFAYVMYGGVNAILWASLCLAMIAAEYALILWLDADYMETAMARSAQQYEALQRFKRGQVMSYRSNTRRRRWTLPSFPRWAGYGPIAWRQLLGALHNWGWNVIAIYVVAVAAGLYGRQFDHSNTIKDVSPYMVLATLAYISIVITNLFRFDFRSEIDTMDWLKTLPVSATVVSIAQITAPVVVLSSIYFAIALGAAIAVNRPEMLLLVLMLAVPFAVLLMAIENLTFLLWPVRMAHPQNLDAQSFGRSFISFFIKGLIIVPACGIAAAVVFVNHYLFGSMALGYLFGGVVLCIEAAAVIPFVASAYTAYDPSIDTPP